MLGKMWEEDAQCALQQSTHQSSVFIFSPALTTTVLHFEGNLLKTTQTGYFNII